MTETSFMNIYDNIRGKWLPTTKMSAARDAFNNSSNYFTADQAVRIISLVDNEANKLELAKLSYDNIVDPQNFGQISNLLTKQSDRDELDRYVRSTTNRSY